MANLILYYSRKGENYCRGSIPAGAHLAWSLGWLLEGTLESKYLFCHYLSGLLRSLESRSAGKIVRHAIWPPQAHSSLLRRGAHFTPVSGGD